MLRMMIAAAAVLSPTTASDSSTITLSDDGYKARISYQDLHLGSPTDRIRMTGRIRRAASLLCLGPYNPDPLIQPSVRAECFRVAVQSGVDQMNAIPVDKAG